MGKKESKGIVLIKLMNVEKPKVDGAWGLKNIHFFEKELVAKSL